MPEFINDQNRELLRRSIQKARRHLDFAEAALTVDTPSTPAHDAVWKNITAAAISLRTGSDLVASIVVDESVKEPAHAPQASPAAALPT